MNTKMEEPDRIKFMSLFYYDKETGNLLWREDRNSRARAGSIAGSLTSKGYLSIGVDGNYYRAHHIVWCMFMGSLPDFELDHINGNKLDNRIENLRDGRYVNRQNVIRPNRLNASGFLGVFRGSKNRFKASIRVNNRSLHIGSYPTPEEAHAAYLAAKRKYHQGCTI